MYFLKIQVFVLFFMAKYDVLGLVELLSRPCAVNLLKILNIYYNRHIFMKT